MIPPVHELLTRREAAEYLGVTPYTMSVYHLRGSGRRRIKAYRRGTKGRLFFDRRDLEAFLTVGNTDKKHPAPDTSAESAQFLRGRGYDV